ncbi:Co2+/Mg2+ efflux protein ApaG [Nitrogeniibacter mangrovi]|uniref:Protein ApaG n=1 Tax=Nitrogeniibacter mangrovi TaxID=2016596 RepID=A0A6C1B239_9RHOO|nr:Co2+/Mg2+ efflux protein ApaG [Nitrogeniibacter mangrovi]QID17049.1 Co2+/Mg2+ efflux protein ApaG [Nitrogeniibacter mangrovi]
MSDDNTPNYRIDVTAKSFYLEDQSRPDEDEYVFAYRITLTNTGNVTAQLISRHWIISDGNGDVQEVRGLGVVGEHPELAPGESFEYASGCSLPTPVGSMRGTYQMVAADGENFEAEIPEFGLAVPNVLH